MASRTLPLFYGLSLIIIIIPNLASVGEFGRYCLVFQLFTVIALLNKSLFLNPMVRFASEPDQYNRMIRSGLYMSAIFYIVCGVIVQLISPLAATILRVEATDLRLVYVLMAAFFFRDFGFFTQQIRYRTAKLFFIEAVYFLGSIAGFIFLAISRDNLIAREILMVNIIAAVCSSMLALSLGLGTRLIGHVDISAISKIVGYGVYTLPIGLASSFMNSADTLVLGIIYTPTIVGVYNGAKQVYRIFSAITQAVGILVLPYASRLSAANHKEELKALFEKTTVYVWIGLAGVSFVVWLISGWLYMFLGDKYAGSAPLLAIMLLAAPFEGVFYVVGNILYAIGKAAKVALVSTGSLILLVALLLPGAYFMGTKGVAWALCLSLVIACVWIYRVSCRILDSGLTPSIQRLALNLKSLLKIGG